MGAAADCIGRCDRLRTRRGRTLRLQVPLRERAGGAAPFQLAPPVDRAPRLRAHPRHRPGLADHGFRHRRRRRQRHARSVEWGSIRTERRALASGCATSSPALGRIVREFQPGRDRDRARVLAPQRRQRAQAGSGARAPRSARRSRRTCRSTSTARAHIKQAVVGRGGAEKEQVQRMVQMILGVQRCDRARRGGRARGRDLPRARARRARPLASGREDLSGGTTEMIGFLRGTLISEAPAVADARRGRRRLRARGADVDVLSAARHGPASSCSSRIWSCARTRTCCTASSRKRSAPVPQSAQDLGRRAADRARRAVGHERRGVLSVHPRQGSSRASRRFRASASKTAERLLVEMARSLAGVGWSRSAPRCRRARPAEGEAHGALLALGYKPGEVAEDAARTRRRAAQHRRDDPRGAAARAPSGGAMSDGEDRWLTSCASSRRSPVQRTKRSTAPCARAGSTSTSASRA